MAKLTHSSDITILLVSYNSKDLTIRCLTSITKNCPKVEIVVVDNGSIDGSAEVIESLFPRVELIRSKENLGFGRANNLAAKNAAGRFLFLVNTDTWMLNDVPTILVEYLQNNPKVYACGPQQFQENYSPQVVGGVFPSITTLLWDHLHLWRIFPESISKKFRVLGKHLNSYPCRYEYLMGSALMFRREVWEKLQGFDPDFFFYYEETELCHRLKRMGGEIHLVPEAEMVHLHGGSTGGQNGRETFESFLKLRNSERLYFQKTSGSMYWKHYRLLSMMLFWVKSKITNSPILWNNYLAYKAVPNG